MSLVKEKLNQKNTSIIVLDSKVKSYNLDSGKEEMVEEYRTCGHNLCGQFKDGYCKEREIGISPGYHCDKTKNFN